MSSDKRDAGPKEPAATAANPDNATVAEQAGEPAAEQPTHTVASAPSAPVLAATAPTGATDAEPPPKPPEVPPEPAAQQPTHTVASALSAPVLAATAPTGATDAEPPPKMAAESPIQEVSPEPAAGQAVREREEQVRKRRREAVAKMEEVLRSDSCTNAMDKAKKSQERSWLLAFTAYFTSGDVSADEAAEWINRGQGKVDAAVHEPLKKAWSEVVKVLRGPHRP